jgi:transketolase
MKNLNKVDAKIRCKEYRRRILKISQKVKALHIGGAFSCIEIVDAIYFHLMKKKNKKNYYDTFIMSKGHGCMTQYVILEKLGIMPKKFLENYCTKNYPLGVHPDVGLPGIYASTGSLGHGMGLATGMAYAEKIKKNKNKIFVLLSDGELQEGSTWENIMMAANLKLDNLVAFLDHNGSQSFGITKITHPKFYPIVDKINSFGWEVRQVDGHDTKKIINTYKKQKNKKPLMILCNTIKGKGVSYMENKPIWHYRSPNKEEFNIAMSEIDKN